MTLSRILTATALSTAALAAPAMAAEDCGDVSIAEMNWASAGLAAWVDKIILEEGYGCNVALLAGDTVPTFTSMREKAEPDIAPEIWVNAIRENLFKAVEEKRVVLASEILSDGGVEGFWIPTWLSEEHNIKTLNDALAHPELFPGAEDTSKGAFFSCPSGWGCQLITQNQFRAMDGEGHGFALVDPGSAAGLDGAIAKAFNRKEGWLGYYWGPSSILGKYDLTRLDLEVEHKPEMYHDCIVKKECAKPELTEWPETEVYTVVTEPFSKANPVAMEYLSKRAWGNDTVNAMLAWMADNQATNEDGAYEFLEKHPDVWTKWLPEDVAQKVKDSL